MGVPSSPIKGFINAEIITEEEEYAEYIEVVNKHPDETDLENAKQFAKEILDKC